MINRYVAVLVGAALASAGPLAAQAPISASDLLNLAIRYHDPSGEWASFAHALAFEERRPGGVARETRVGLDVPAGRFVYEIEDEGTRITKSVDDDDCTVAVDGSSRVTDAEVERYGLECASILRSRNYYLYLWGLPMKVRDPGTLVDPEVRMTTFLDDEVLALRVTYEASVGSDTWYFYFEPDTYRMTGYRFYHDEGANDGEYIVLDGEYRLGSMLIPRSRSWYTNAEGRFLGEDVLMSHSPVSP